jgi:hypothetical protein
MALRFLTIPLPASQRAIRSDDEPVSPTGVLLGFRDGTSQTFDSSSPAGRAFRALAEVLALRSRTVRVSEET